MFYLDGDTDNPTICGTGLEDYAGTAWGMGTHQAPWPRVPHDIRAIGLAERQDDYSSASFFYLQKRQPVPRVDAVATSKNLEHLLYEKPSEWETNLAAIGAIVEQR